jgi:hypothetical protein
MLETIRSSFECLDSRIFVNRVDGGLQAAVVRFVDNCF